MFKLPEPSELGSGALALDTETTGLDSFRGARPVGLSVCSLENPERSFYIPWAHENDSENLDAQSVKLWASELLRDRDVYFAHARFDVQMLHAWGLDLEALNVKPHDVQFHAALLDEKRTSYSLDSLAHDYLNDSKLSFDDDGRKIHERSAAEVEDYAKKDVELTARLASLFAPGLSRDGLTAVAALEDGLIYVVSHSERQGARLDCTKLEQWQKVCRSRYFQLLFSIHNKVGRKINVNSTPHLLKLFELCNVEHEGRSVTYNDLVKYATQHPAIAAALDARRYSGLLSKYLDKYAEAVEPSGIIRYSLNQLRSDHLGTVSGRFSSSDINIQQVFADEHQEGVISDFPIRELFIPEKGKRWVSADAAQIEFRLFAHYAKDKTIIEAYKNDPETDFHQVVADIVKLPRSAAKGISLGSLYGMGLERMVKSIQATNPKATRKECEQSFKDYHERFPAVRKLYKHAIQQAEKNGYVKTFLGRRRRYVKDEKMHSALNAVIQGTAADLMKLKLRELYDEQKALHFTMRFTVHDEVDGDIDEDPTYALVLKKFLDAPSMPLKVPILWDVQTGENWRLK